MEVPYSSAVVASPTGRRHHTGKHNQWFSRKKVKSEPEFQKKWRKRADLCF